jgi:heptosyltransferase I
MPPQHFRRALFVRLDRIGDLVLSLPTDASLTINEVDWWIPKGLSFVTDTAQPGRRGREFGQHLKFDEVIDLVRIVRKNRYDLAVVFHAPWWASFVLWAARVPVRIGVLSQWHSFLFFNRGVRQKRSLAEASELEYNFRLLESGLDLKPGTLKRQTLKLHAKSGRPALAPEGDFYVVHPGMSGSALNWSTERYATLISQLSLEHPVIITGTASDETFLAPLRTKLPESQKVIWLDRKLSGTELVGLLQNAKAVIAPSTGVLHLAASTGVPTLGLFSQIRAQRAVRWGPMGDRTAVVEPPQECPGDSACQGMTCARENCMDLITVESVIGRLRILVSNA